MPTSLETSNWAAARRLGFARIVDRSRRSSRRLCVTGSIPMRRSRFRMWVFQ
ncbi:myb-related protein Zm38-like [Iris pallida]|uniref:Myb-related protein Zm38-like n=1 Tax=Iris pallida TaxID=29817 RepID=A0AAX6GG98_IRIPA|nr:myb-related protein Zm38-like [Iris pallida]KAJ6842380.1 myb-related protein Zm38-like [Iris pallida]